MAKLQLDIQAWTGGESDSPYGGLKNMVAKTKSVEMRKNLEGFFIENKAIDTGWSIDGDVLVMESLETLGVKNGGILICTDTGKVYLDGVLKTTINTGTTAHNKVLGVGVMTHNSGTQYIYYVTDDSFGSLRIHRSTTDCNTFNINHKNLETDAVYDRIVVYNNINELYIAVGNRVHVISRTEFQSNNFVLQNHESIIGMTRYMDTYKIYANSGRTSIQYTWDGIYTNPKTRQEWVNLPIRCVVNDGAIDYMITGFSDAYSDLYRVAGTDKQKIKANLEGVSDGRVFGEYMSIRDGTIYFSGRNGNDTGVYTYGSYYPGTSDSIVMSYSLPNTVTHHAHEIGFSYFACNDGSIYKVSHTYEDTPEISGEVETIWYQGTLVDKMRLKYLQVSANTRGGSIEIYARTSNSGTFNLLYTIPNSSDTRFDIFYNKIKENYELGDFEKIQFKIKLIGAINSPVCKRFLANFETVK